MAVVAKAGLGPATQAVCLAAGAAINMISTTRRSPRPVSFGVNSSARLRGHPSLPVAEQTTHTSAGYF